MRILVVTPEYLASGGGISTFYRALMPSFRAMGVEVHVIEGSALALGDGSTTVVDGVTVTQLDRVLAAKFRQAFARFDAMPGFANHLAAAWAAAEQTRFGEGYDVVEATDWGLLLAPFVLKGEAPLVVQCHASIGQIAQHDPVRGEGAQDALVKLIESSLLTQAGSVQTYSRANADFWKNATGRNVEMIPPGLEFPPRQSVDVGSEALVVGRLQRWKGPHILAEALQRLGPAAPVVQWVGRDVPWGATASSTAAFLSRNWPETFGRKLIANAPVSPRRVAEMQAAARYNIVPSTWDVFNFTAAEAMASGRPTIVSTGAGASEIVEDGATGFLFESEDAESLADAIARVEQLSENERTAIGKAGRESVALLLNPEERARQRLEAYRAAANSTPRGSGWIEANVAPDPDASSTGMAFLDAFPARKLAGYLLGRVGQNLSGRISRIFN